MCNTYYINVMHNTNNKSRHENQVVANNKSRIKTRHFICSSFNHITYIYLVILLIELNSIER